MLPLARRMMLLHFLVGLSLHVMYEHALQELEGLQRV